MATEDRSAASDQPLDRAIALLGALASASRPLSVTELAATCAYPVPTVHRLVAQLEQRRLVKRAFGSRKVLVGPALVQLGTAAAHAAMSSDPTHRILVSLSENLGEPCHLGVRSGDEITYVDSARSRRSSGLHFEQGRRAPMHCTSIGKIYLAELSDAELDAWLAHADLQKLAPATIASRPKLKAVVKEVRKKGWATSNEEFAPGVVGCAVAVRLPDGRLLAGLGVSAPSARTSPARLRSFVAHLHEAARRIALAVE
jgi:IclR family transcriptional regulator, acetate operon repressor